MSTNYEIRSLLKSVGVSPDLNGYFYLTDAIEAVKEDMEQKKRIRKFTALYVTIANTYGTNWKAVERCMRHAIIKAYEKQIGRYSELIPNSKDIPTISQFVCLIAEHLIIESEV